MVVQHQSQIGEGSVNPTDFHHTPTFIQPSPQPQKTQKPRKPKRKDIQVPQPSDPSDNVVDEAVYKELGDSLVRAATTASSLEVEQDSGNITKTRSKATPNESSSLGTTSGGGPRCQETMGDTIAQIRFENVSKLSNDSLFARGNTLRSDKDRLKLNELMELCTTLQKKVLDLEKTKITQANEIAKSFGDEESLGEDAPKQERINAIDADEDITMVNVQDDADKEMYDVGTVTGDEVFAEQEVAAKDLNVTVDEVTLAQAITALKSVKPKVKGDVIEEPNVPVNAASASTKVSAATTTTATIRTPRKGIVITELGTPTITRSSQQPSQAEVQDKGKGKMIEPELAKIEVDHELAQRDASRGARRVVCSSKRAGEELEQESTKKQKVDENKYTAELQSLMEVILDEEENRYFQIIRADGSSKIYLVFSQLLKSVDKEDLVELYKLVKAKYRSTRPVDDMDLLLWGYLKTMFEPHVEDEIWKLQQSYKVLSWKLFDSCGVHCLIWNDLHAGRKEISPYTTYNYIYAEQEASG
ncbi:hypothetical protein Tco_1005160 [Tanacetum coccineum]|uniref:Uncharacterized protein n=1 Tax=Tanacetum coccineum TaxID=301880 RepID=A0ABQ5FGE4_9ASTR